MWNPPSLQYYKSLAQLLIGVFTLSLLSTKINAQSDLPSLDFHDYDVWKKISGEQISNNGSLVVYHEVAGKGDQMLRIKSTDGSTLLSYARGESASISEDSRHVVFTIKPHQDSIRAAKRRKTKEDEMPTDSLGIYNIESDLLTKIPNVKSFELPEKWNGYVVYTLDKIKMKDTSAMPASDTIKTPIFKKVNEDNGYHLIVQNLSTSATDTLKYVKVYDLSHDCDRQFDDGGGLLL